MAAHNDPEERKLPQPLDGSPRPAHGAGQRRGRRAAGPRPGWLEAQAARVNAVRARVEAEQAARRAAGLPL